MRTIRVDNGVYVDGRPVPDMRELLLELLIKHSTKRINMDALALEEKIIVWTAQSYDYVSINHEITQKGIDFIKENDNGTE